MAKKGLFWTKEEIKLLKKIYPSDISNEKLLAKFNNKSISALAHKASRLGIKRGKYFPEKIGERKWSEEEIKMVCKYYGKMSDKELMELLPNRSMCGIKRMATKYNSKYKKKKIFSRNPSWSELEDALLLEHYQSKTTCELMELFPSRTYDGIRSRIWVLGLVRNKTYLKRSKLGFQWTDEELEILRKNKDKDVKYLKNLLPQRSSDSIRAKRKNLVRKEGKQQ